MAEDLRTLLRAADGGPADPDHEAIRRRGRRLAATRAVLAAAAAVLVVGAAAGVTVTLLDGQRGSVPVIQNPPSPTEATQPTEGEDGDGGRDVAASVTAADIGRPVLVAGDDGVRRIDGDHEERLWDGAAITAVPDLRGGIVLQEPDPGAEDGPPAWSFGPIRWLPAGDGGSQQLAGPDDRAVLHAVGEVEGRPVALLTRRTGDRERGDDEEERLYAHDLAAGDERDLGLSGGIESGVGAADVAGGRLAVSSCHLQCDIRVLPADGGLRGDPEWQLDAGFYHGLDLEQGSLAYVEIAPREDFEAPGDLRLMVATLAGDGAVEAWGLPTVDAPWNAVMADVDLAPDLSAALVGLIWYDADQDRWERRTLFVDRLDGEARTRTVSGVDSRIRFDVPGPSPVDGDGGEADEGQVTAADRQLVGDLLAFVEEPGTAAFERVPFADEVALGVADDLLVTRRRSELVDPDAWTLDVELFRAYSGPFSLFRHVRDVEDPVVSVGEHPHCASPPVPAPAEVEDLRRVSVQPDPDRVESCLQWWTVDLFVTPEGRVVAVTLDLYEP